MRRIAPLFVLAAALLVPVASRAQSLTAGQPATTPVAVASVAAPAGPTLDDATVGIRHSTSQAVADPTNVGAAVRHGSQPTALMIVGGAAFLAGAIISGNSGSAGTIIMVGGAAVGLYGLYLYLQ